MGHATRGAPSRARTHSQAPRTELLEMAIAEPLPGFGWLFAVRVLALAGRFRPLCSLPNTCSPIARAVADLPTPELVENQRRSIAMLPTGVAALNRDEALELLAQFEAALVELRRLRAELNEP